MTQMEFEAGFVSKWLRRNSGDFLGGQGGWCKKVVLLKHQDMTRGQKELQLQMWEGLLVYFEFVEGGEI